MESFAVFVVLVVFVASVGALVATISRCREAEGCTTMLGDRETGKHSRSLTSH